MSPSLRAGGLSEPEAGAEPEPAATFTLWSNGTYSTGQALPHRKGEGKSRKNSKYLWLILRICTLVAQKVSAYGKDFRKAEG